MSLDSQSLSARALSDSLSIPDVEPVIEVEPVSNFEPEVDPSPAPWLAVGEDVDPEEESYEVSEADPPLVFAEGLVVELPVWMLDSVLGELLSAPDRSALFLELVIANAFTDTNSMAKITGFTFFVIFDLLVNQQYAVFYLSVASVAT